MDPMRLRLLRELGDRGSVTAVAAAVGISASAVSQQLAALQAGVPVPLTVKKGRTLALTEAGEALAAAGVRVEEALAGARDAVGAFLQHPDRTVSVSAFHSAGLALFRPLLAALGDEGPAVSLRDADVARSEFPRLTADHDLVIAHRLAHEPDWPADRLHVTPLFVEALDVALPRSHPLAGEPRVTPEQLRDERWISVHDGFPLANALDQLAAAVGRPLRIEHRINEFFVAAQLVRAGAAIALMPRITAGLLADDELVLRPVDGLALARHVDVLARPEAVALTPVRRVLRALQTVAAGAAGPTARPPLDRGA
jgi:DNA-binding transcriptional LysR family regulator